MDKELYYDLALAAQYCKTAEDFCDQISDKEATIKMWESTFYSNKEAKERPLKKLRTASLIIFICSAIVCALTLTVTLAGEATSTDAVFLPVSAVFLVIFLSLFIISKIRLKKTAIDFKERRDHLDASIEEEKESILEITKAAEKFAEENRYLLDVIPQQYRNLQATSYILVAVKNGRADTLKEAINLYEEQLHRWRLESAARQSAEAQEYLARAVEELSAQQEETNERLRYIQYAQLMNNHSKD